VEAVEKTMAAAAVEEKSGDQMPQRDQPEEGTHPGLEVLALATMDLEGIALWAAQAEAGHTMPSKLEGHHKMAAMAATGYTQPRLREAMDRSQVVVVVGRQTMAAAGMAEMAVFASGLGRRIT